jgi:hypothetical protein
MEDERRAMAQLVWRHSEELRLALEERQGVTKRDELCPMLLSAQYLEMVRTAMADDERIVRLWAAKKATTHLPDYPMLVILFEPAWWRGSWSGPTAGLLEDVFGRVQADGWVHLYVIELGASTAWMAKRMERIEGSLVFERT